MKQAEKLLSLEENTQLEAYETTRLLEDGSIPFGSSRITKKAQDEAKKAHDKWKSSSKRTAGAQALNSFAGAAERDSVYAAAGRHYLRGGALNGRNATAYGRARLLGLARQKINK